VTITERDEAHGLLAQRDFGGTKKWRACFVSDGTGHAMLYAISDQTIANSIPVHERTEALALIHAGGRCYGADRARPDDGRTVGVRGQGNGEWPPVERVAFTE
jgi:fumarate reductase flavoprotein subunit